MNDEETEEAGERIKRGMERFHAGQSRDPDAVLKKGSCCFRYGNRDNHQKSAWRVVFAALT